MSGSLVLGLGLGFLAVVAIGLVVALVWLVTAVARGRLRLQRSTRSRPMNHRRPGSSGPGGSVP